MNTQSRTIYKFWYIDELLYLYIKHGFNYNTVELIALLKKYVVSIHSYFSFLLIDNNVSM